MKELIKYLPDTLSILIASIAIIISILSWRKSRSIYSIEYSGYRFNKGNDHPDNQELLNKLKSGKYTILNTHYNSPKMSIILGKIKK